MRKNYFKSIFAIAALAMTSLSASAQDGYKADSDCNMVKTLGYNLTTWAANSDWSTNATQATVEQNGTTYTITLPASDAQWMNQVRFRTNIPTNVDTKYQTSAKVKSSVDLDKVTFKIEKENAGDDASKIVATEFSLKANEEYLIKFTGDEKDEDGNALVTSKDVNGIDILFDFGGNPDNTVITISELVFREAGCDDDTYVYIPPTGPQVEINGSAFTQVGISETEAFFEGELVQGKPYTFTGSDASIVNGSDFYYNPDYFTKQADGTYTFNALTGNYHIYLNTGNKYFHIWPLNDAGEAAQFADNGALYVNGGKHFGKPSYSINPNHWGGGDAGGWSPNLNLSVSAAQILKGYYRLTLTAGKQIGTETGSTTEFKFYSAGTGWGDSNIESNKDHCATVMMSPAADFFTIGGNIGLSQALAEGDTYVVYLDLREETLAKYPYPWIPEGVTEVLNYEKATDETGAGTEAAQLAAKAAEDYKTLGISSIKADTTDGAIYNLQGVRVAAPQKGLYIQNGKKFVVK